MAVDKVVDGLEETGEVDGLLESAERGRYWVNDVRQSLFDGEFGLADKDSTATKEEDVLETLASVSIGVGLRLEDSYICRM